MCVADPFDDGPQLLLRGVDQALSFVDVQRASGGSVLAGWPRPESHRGRYRSGSPNAVVMDGADEARNRYGAPATSS